MSGPLLFTGRVAVVTGAAAGLGRRYAIDLAKRGAAVVINDMIGSKGLAETEQIIKNSGGKCVASYNNVLDGDKIVADAVKNFGACDIVINNAGILRDKSFHKMSKEERKSVIDVHLNGSFEVSHAAWPIMRERQYGRIINISSAAGLYGNFGQTNYSSAKMGIIGLTNSLAVEGIKYNITANCVIPLAASQTTADLIPKEFLEMLDPDHITAMVSYLAHEQASGITGQSFEVGGGWFSAIRWQRSQGITLGTKDRPATMEDVAANLRSITDYSSSTNPSFISDSLKAMIASSDIAAAAKIKGAGLGVGAPAGTTPASGGAAQVSNLPLASDDLFVAMQQYFTTEQARAVIAASDIKATVQFDISNAAGVLQKRWMIDSTTDSPSVSEVPVADTQPSKATVVLRCNDETICKVADGSLSPEYAYMRGLMKIRGPMHVALKVKKLLDVAAHQKHKAGK